MADVVITTDTANLRAHDIYFEFTIQDTSATTYDALLHDFGSLKCEFDIPNSGTEVTAIGLKQSAIDVVIDDRLDGGDRLIETLNSAFDFSNETWFCDMYIRDSGGSFGDPIEMQFAVDDIEFDEVSKLVTIGLLPKNQSSSTVEDVVALGAAYDLSFTAGTPTNADATTARNFIEDGLGDVYTGTPVVDTVLQSGNPGTTGNFVYLVPDALPASGAGNPNTDDPLQLIGLIATYEGAVFGKSYGEPFYIPRNYTGSSVTLDTDNITKLRSKKFVEAQYRSLTIEQSPETATDVSQNLYAEKNINIVFTSEGLYRSEITGSAGPPLLYTADQVSYDSTLIDEGIINYGLAFSFDNNIILEVDYWGIGSIYPYSTITFDGDAPTQYQSKNFRIKRIEYDFKRDTVKMRMYEI